MTDHSHTSADPPRERGHEPTILSGRIALVWGTALAGVVFFALLLTWGLWQWMGAGGPTDVAPVDGKTRNVENLIAVQAPLNPDQPATRRAYEQRQRALLTEYAWVDRQTEMARIPIERAMEIIVERESSQ
jgi:hypothetical protein